MIHPLCPFTLRGAIWYQGESNSGEGKLYTEHMKALVGGWREIWGEGEFPFYFVQIAPYNYGGDPEVIGEFWDAQAAAAEEIRNCGMAVINDIGNLRDIHPKNKQEVGAPPGVAGPGEYLRPGFGGLFRADLQIDKHRGRQAPRYVRTRGWVEESRRRASGLVRDH